VISLDEKAREPFKKAAKTIKELRMIMWANPDKPEEEVLIWLADGVAIETKRQLGD
jgi:hypothetical protein